VREKEQYKYQKDQSSMKRKAYQLLPQILEWRVQPLQQAWIFWLAATKKY